MKVTKGNKDVEDGPEAKKAKIDATESTMIKKVPCGSGRGDSLLRVRSCK